MTSDAQLKSVRGRFELSNHTFMAKLAEAIAARIKADTGLEVKMVGKEANGDSIKATLIGETVGDGDVEKRVATLMAELKNPSTLIGLMR